MAKLTLGQKAERVLQMLMGFGNARIATAMAAYGLTQAGIDEGWDLRKATSRVRGSRQNEYTASPTVVANADAWENHWFPIIDASLARRFPEIHATVFNNLSQTEGPPVLLGISLLLERLVELEKATDKTSKDARALLKDPVHHPREPVVVAMPVEMHELVHDDVLEALGRLLGQLEVEPDAPGLRAA